MRIVLAALAAFAATACDCGTPPPPQHATCTGSGCTCSAGTCVCSAGQTCSTTCDSAGCSLDCNNAAKCNASSPGPVTVTCEDTSQCKGNGGDGSHITCDTSS